MRSLSEYIKDKASTMTNKRFFTSPAFEGAMTRFARNLTGRFDVSDPITVHIVWVEEGSEGCVVAFTNGSDIVVNAANPLADGLHDRESIYHMIRGLIMHECGHILQTDFEEDRKLIHRLQSGGGLLKGPLTGYPADAITEANEYIRELKNPTLISITINLLRDMINSIEDGYVNDYMKSEFPGGRWDITSCLDAQYETNPTLEELLDAESEEDGHRFFTLRNIVWEYAVFADVKCEGYLETHSVMREAARLQEFVDAALATKNCRRRFYIEVSVFALLFPYFKDYMDKMIEKYGNDAPERIKKALSGPSPRSAAPKRTETSGAAAKTMEGSSDEEEDGVTALAAMPDGDPSEGDDEGADGSGATKEGSKDPEEGEESKDAASTDGEDGADADDGDAKKGIADHKRPPFKKEDAPYDPRTGDALERILNEAAKAEATAELEKDRGRELTEEAAAIRHSAIHEGFTARVDRIPSPTAEMAADYEKVGKPLERIAKKTAQEVSKILVRRRAGGVQHNLYLGRRLDAGALARHDGRVMSRRKLPQPHPTLAVALRVDESGSMSSGDRIRYAQAASIVLYHFCRMAQIPCAIYGDDETDTVNIRSYVEFDEKDGADKLRLMSMQARSNNRDGYAIKFVAERLKKRREDIKLLFVISDGAPYARKYSGRTAIEDMKFVIKDAEKSGIITIAAAIGDDRDAIRSIYGDERFLDIKNLEELPASLLAVLRRYLKA